MRLLVLLSGDHPNLPEAEFRSVLDADGYVWHEVERHGRLLVGDLARRGRQDPVGGEVRETVSRLAMTHEVVRHHVTADRTAEALTVAAGSFPLDGAGTGSFAVRAERAPGTERSAGPGRKEVEETLGGLWAESLQVDLIDPDRLVRCWLLPDRVLIGEVLWQNDRSRYEARAIRHRPFFSPISGHPRWMRAIVNLAAGSPPAVVYDPLCGTGGILLEAALAGHHVVGSDIDPRMVEGTRQNLEHAQQEGLALFEADVREAPAGFRRATGSSEPDAIVTDLPYGQSASTKKEGTLQVAQWTLAAIAALLPLHHRAVIGVADETWLQDLPPGLVVESTYALRVHKSLTRTYAVLRAVP